MKKYKIISIALLLFLFAVPFQSQAKVSKVKNVKVTNITQDSAKVQWTKVKKVSFYKMKLQTKKGKKLNT